jgi:hypothetical protein
MFYESFDKAYGIVQDLIMDTDYAIPSYGFNNGPASFDLPLPAESM